MESIENLTAQMVEVAEVELELSTALKEVKLSSLPAPERSEILSLKIELAQMFEDLEDQIRVHETGGRRMIPGGKNPQGDWLPLDRIGGGGKALEIRERFGLSRWATYILAIDADDKKEGKRLVKEAHERIKNKTPREKKPNPLDEEKDFNPSAYVYDEKGRIIAFKQKRRKVYKVTVAAGRKKIEKTVRVK